MKRIFNETDRNLWAKLESVMRDNDRILRATADFLNRMPRFLTQDLVNDLTSDGILTQEDAFRALYSASIGLDCAARREDRRLEQQYIAPGVFLSDPATYLSDLYLTTLHFPTASIGTWKFIEEEYLPWEVFPCGNPIFTRDLRSIPRVSAFPVPFRFPAVTENGVEWMAVKPNEIETMKEPIANAEGHLLTLGLGLGYFTFHASMKENVTSVTVVERDENLVKMFREHLLPQFPHKEKVQIITADALDVLANAPANAYDTVFADLWHDQSDGLPLYIRLKKLEERHPRTHFDYWIEPTLLSSLRLMVYDRLCDENDGGEITSFQAAASMLTDSFLRKLAKDLRADI